MNTQKKSKTGSENYAPGKGKGAKKTLRIDKTDFVENSLSVDTRKSKRREDRTALEINTFQTDDGSNDDLIVSNIRTIINQESSCERSTLNNMKKNISQRYQQVKKENEMKLPLTFGRGAKKILRIDKTFDCVENSFSVDTRENKIREDRTASEVNAFQTDDGDDDDDEPIIDRPEDYLNTSSTMTTYRPSFVPDTHDREKLAGLAETNRLFESHEDVSVAGPSVITSLPTPDGKEQDDSSHRLSDLECDRMIENVDSAVSQVSSSSASLEPGPSGMTTSAKSDVFNLSLTFKEVTTKSAKSEEKKAVLTLNSEEMSTLLSLIELAKNHVATGKDLSSNFPQVLQTCQDASNSNATEPQGMHSGKNQQQPSISQGSTDMQDIAENENARATSLESIDMDDISNSEKNATATTESGGIIDIPESERNVRATTECASTMHDIPESERYVRAISEAAMDDVTESERNVRAITENAAMDDITESERNVRATASINERMKNKTKTVNYTKDVISKNECKQGAIKNIKPISCKSNIKNNKVINDGQSAKHVASRINKKIGRIPKDKTDETILKKKKSNDHLSQSKADDKHPQSRNRGQGSKTDGKQLKIMKNPEQSSRENLDETTQELVKGKAQSPKKKKLHDVKDVSSSKKKNIQHDENSQFSKNGTKSSVFERTFKLMQSVKVDVSLSQETIALCKRVKHHQGITEHKNQKKWLKKVGKRIFMNDLSDSEDDSSSTKLEKDESPEAGKQPREMHPLYQKTSVPDHSVSVCLFCKCNLKFDELSTVSLNTGTVTLKCRNCHTYRKMEKVLSLQCYAGSPSFQNIASTASEATGTSEGNNNCEVNKKRNLTASSKQRKNENIRKKDGSLKRTHSTKQASKEKGYSQQEVNVNSVKEKKKNSSLSKSYRRDQPG
ncbi:hypothetical protein E2C01_014430 [Portunus trituberculatus]|uniref:Uncharacterized protein n=1 Tax=Portunus trituberculatus TaxID=210409 RepID=A0A5B7DJW0_PORTR|nr:hypothetical protein [Portunus trituberculatus]